MKVHWRILENVAICGEHPVNSTALTNDVRLVTCRDCQDAITEAMNLQSDQN
jgi:hypothetical protein